METRASLKYLNILNLFNVFVTFQRWFHVQDLHQRVYQCEVENILDLPDDFLYFHTKQNRQVWHSPSLSQPFEEPTFYGILGFVFVRQNLSSDFLFSAKIVLLVLLQ